MVNGGARLDDNVNVLMLSCAGLCSARKINDTDRHVAYVPSLNVKATDNGDSGCGSHLRANDLEPVIEERLESGVKERLRHGGYLESNSGIRQ